MPKIYWDRFGRSTETVQNVIVDTVQVPIPHQQGQTRDSLPRSIATRLGRILGSRDTYAYAEITGGANNLTADECRALAEALMVAADVLDGTREAELLTAARKPTAI